MKKYLKFAGYLFVFIIILVAGTNIWVRLITLEYIHDDLSKLPHCNTAIIFGAGINNNKPGKYLKDRLDTGIRLYKEKKVNKLLLSGDNGNDAHDELTVMKQYCNEQGVDTNKIYLDYAGFDSYSTMYRAKQVFKVDTAILVSQKYHLSRAVFIGNKLGLKSYGFSSNNGPYKGYTYVRFREIFAITKSALDVILHRKPHFLGDPVSINGPSNYTKNSD